MSTEALQMSFVPPYLSPSFSGFPHDLAIKELRPPAFQNYIPRL